MRAQPPSFIHTTTFLKRYSHISKHLLISKTFIMFESKCVSSYNQKCELFFCAFISTPALQTVGWLVCLQGKEQRVNRPEDLCRRLH